MGCASNSEKISSVSKLNQLTPGMSQKEVVNLLGYPWDKVVVDSLKWKYSLQQYGKGWQFFILFLMKIHIQVLVQ